MKILRKIELPVALGGCLVCFVITIMPTIERDGLWPGLWHLLYPGFAFAVVVSLTFNIPLYFF